MAIVLWTCAKRLDVGNGNKFELCSMLNEAIRSHDGTTLECCVRLVAMLQNFLTAKRRGKPITLPEGPYAESGKRKGEEGWSTTKGIVYRGGGLPDTHVSFFEKMKATGHPYRVPHLLATSFDESVTLGFMRKTRGSKVLWTIKIPPRGCMHANYIDSQSACSGEQEYLFCAFSAFRVLEVKRSADATKVSTPHEITLEAVSDNKDISDGVPSAPWC